MHVKLYIYIYLILMTTLFLTAIMYNVFYQVMKEMQEFMVVEGISDKKRQKLLRNLKVILNLFYGKHCFVIALFLSVYLFKNYVRSIY